jgi:dTDP-4-dehydrorhamnose 3,5-epimerase
VISVDRSTIPGVLHLKPEVHADARGIFVKNYRQDWFIDLDIPTVWPERFYTRSRERVIRGLHLQAPPSDHEKLVYCANGAAFDVVVDLRIGSPTFGEFDVIRLDDESRISVFIPKGVAHGFASLSDGTVMVYATSTVHDPVRDGGIRWDSVPIPWPFEDPIISPRDEALPTFAAYDSPFSYDS